MGVAPGISENHGHTLSRTPDANSDCAFVECGLVFAVPKIGRGVGHLLPPPTKNSVNHCCCRVLLLPAGHEKIANYPFMYVCYTTT